VFLAHDASGNICSGTSTSGWGWKYPGRLGDSPIVGAGSYADTRYGAAACTGAGEMTIRCCTARSIVLYMKRGATVVDAVGEAVEDMRALKGGLISRVTIHEGQSQGGGSQRHRRQQVLAVGRAGRATLAAGRTDRDHPRHGAADRDVALHQRAVIATGL
jgi:hypothetical protein